MFVHGLRVMTMSRYVVRLGSSKKSSAIKELFINYLKSKNCINAILEYLNDMFNVTQHAEEIIFVAILVFV